MDKKVLSLGRTSPVLADTSSPIKAIRVSRDGGKDGTSLASGWSSSWNEGNEFEKVRNVTQRRKLGLLSAENRQLTGDRDSVSRKLEAEKMKNKELKGENERLREVNLLVVSRIHNMKENNLSALKKQETSFNSKHEQVTASLHKKIKVLQEKKHPKSCKEIEAQLSKIEAQCSKIEAQRSKIEALELQNKSISTALEAARCKQESEAASREHVVVMLVVAEDKQVQISGGAQVEETYVEAEVTSEPVSVDDEVMDKSGKHLEAIPEFGSCESPHYSDKDAPVTPPISPGKPAQLDDNALDFDRPIPLHMSWADMVEDDSRWYEDSENEAEQVPTVNIESTAVVAVETRAAEDEAKAPVVEPSEEQGWLSRKGHGEFRAFRAFNHYRASSFDNSSKRTSKRSPRKSPTYQSQAAHNGPAKQVSQSTSRHQRHKSMDRFIGGQSSDDTSPWPEWSAGTPRNYGNVQKVGSGVLVVNRKAPKPNAPATAPSRRSKSDIPQCRRHIAGYCKFEDQCWFRHD